MSGRKFRSTADIRLLERTRGAENRCPSIAQKMQTMSHGHENANHEHVVQEISCIRERLREHAPLPATMAVAVMLTNSAFTNSMSQLCKFARYAIRELHLLYERGTNLL